jgi:hypothetical protein
MEEHQCGSVELVFFFLSLLSVAGESARCARRSRRATELLRESGIFLHTSQASNRYQHIFISVRSGKANLVCS